MTATSPNFRAALLAGSALIFPVLAFPGLAQAQPAPNARPQGGAVVAGSAVIGGDAGRTVINQSTDRAAINWQSFDVGRNQAVQFQQPSSTSVTLNRVVTPNPSQIAGQITANGQVAIVNQSGVIFHQGSTVNAAGLVVSTANISNEAFMRGGRMNFDQPGRPDARIENNGTITVREAGLAALVAPQVANHGVIRARMGRVVLAGAETSVVDLHGDGLLSLEVTSPVRQAPANGQALVTNTGTVTATGGTVVLTAQAVDGIVQDLVRAGGRIAANTDAATGRTGRVVVAGNGGAVRIEGEVSAQGLAAGTRGGTIEAVSDRVLVASTGRVSASGASGGGSIGIGTTVAGNPNPRLARRAGISRGATVQADATVQGDGGRVVLNSSDYSAHSGAISARGGPQGGNGGFVEVSGRQGYSLTGTVNVLGGPGGRDGTFLIDPTNLSIVNGTGPDDGLGTDGQVLSGDGSGDATIGTAVLNAFAGNLVLEATNNLTVFGNLIPQLNLTMWAGNTLTVAAGGSIFAAGGNIDLTAVNFVFNGPVSAPTRGIFLTARTFGATVTQGAAGILTADTLRLNSAGGFTTVALGADNLLSTFTSQNTGLGSVFLRNMGSLRVTGTVGGTANSAVRLDVVGGDLTIAGTVGGGGGNAGTFDGVTALLRATGNVIVEDGGGVVADAIRMQAGYDFTGGSANPAAAGGIQLAGDVAGFSSLRADTVEMAAGTGGIVQTDGTFLTDSLAIISGGNALLNIPVVTDGSGNILSGNDIRALTTSTIAGRLAIVTNQNIDLQGTITALGSISLSASDITQGGSGVLITPRFEASTSVLSVSLLGENQIDELGDVLATTGVDITNARSLLVSGTVRGSNASTTLNVTGNLTVNGSVQGAYGATLRATGDITLAAGSTVQNFENVDFDPAPTVIQAGYDFGAAAPNPASTAALRLGGLVGNEEYTGSVTLNAGTGGIVQTGGRILASTLAVATGGDALLTGASSGTPNSISTLLGVDVAGNFALDNGTSDLAVGISGGTFSARTFAIRTAGAVTVNSPITASERATFRVGSLAFSPFSTPSAGVTAPLVEIAPDSAVGMAVIPGELTPQPFQLSSDIFDRISTSTLRLGATTFGGVTTTTASEINFASDFSFAGTMDVRATGDVFQASGTTLSFGTLTGAAGGAIELNEPTNVLPIVSNLSAGTLLALRTTGSQVLTGTLAAPNVMLTTGGGLTETGAGRITGGTLTLQTGGDALLNGANELTGLGASSVDGRLELKNSSGQLALPVDRVFFTSGYYDIQQTGDLVIDGTITGTAGSLSATGSLQVNGHSAIARTGDLNIQGNVFTLNGLLQAAGAIRILAGTSASLTGTASGTLLSVTSPSIAFGGLSATGTPVLLFLGPGGTATGTLNASSLSVFGGASANLFGSIAGITGGTAATVGRRGTSGGSLLVEPLPSPTLYLFNNCAIGASVCTPVVVGGGGSSSGSGGGTGGGTITPPATSFRVDPYLATSVNPLLQAAVLEPVPALIQQLRPPVPTLSLRLYRDRSEEGELAPPNIRGEDF